jgi:glucans biosynthesis protein
LRRLARAERLGAAAATLLALAGTAPGAAAFGLDDVAQLAAALASAPYVDRQKVVPKWMLVGSMTYDQWRDIRFRPDRAIWRDRHLPFQVQLFHPGLYFDHSVQVNLVDAAEAHPLPFDPGLFNYGKNDFAARIPTDVGYAGLRIHAPLRNPDYFDELIVFLGASYFRALGRDNLYGLSARGLAVDTVEPTGEEFPRFVEFWIVQPAPDAKALELFALLDGPTASGAYRFLVTPGDETRVDVDLRLFPRRVPKTLGIAPLTSMFFFGENSTHHVDDFRPEVHDSDGFLVHFDSGEWLWRPLDNPARIDTASFRTRNPRGFGLLQRDRDFADYQDLEIHAERRPSAWVEPHGDWGDGAVRLVEIPTPNELNDNVVAFWVPDPLPQPGSEADYSYTIWWYGDDATRPPGGRAVATRRDRGAVETPRTGYRYVIDFAGPGLAALPAGTTPRAVVTATRGAVLSDQHVVANPAMHGFRLVFQVAPVEQAPVELRAYLAAGADVLTETWSEVWLP